MKFDVQHMIDYLDKYASGNPMADEALAKFGSTIKEARVSRGWTQTDVARAAGLSRFTISAIERGVVDPRLSTLVMIAETLELDLELKKRDWKWEDLRQIEDDKDGRKRWTTRSEGT